MIVENKKNNTELHKYFETICYNFLCSFELQRSRRRRRLVHRTTTLKKCRSAIQTRNGLDMSSASIGEDICRGVDLLQADDAAIAAIVDKGARNCEPFLRSALTSLSQSRRQLTKRLQKSNLSQLRFILHPRHSAHKTQHLLSKSKPFAVVYAIRAASWPP